MTNLLSNPVSTRDHLAGALDAPILLVEYGDYQCPYCGDAYPIIKALQRQFGDDLCFAFRNFPLTTVHEHALGAAITAEWAASRGAFWEMHDYLFEHQDELRPRQLVDAAGRLGLDRAALEHSFRDGVLLDRIAEDIDSGTRSGVSGTPGFFINGIEFMGPWTLDHLGRALRAAGRSSTIRRPRELVG